MVRECLDELLPLRREVLRVRAEFGAGASLEMDPEDVADVIEGRDMSRRATFRGLLPCLIVARRAGRN